MNLTDIINDLKKLDGKEPYNTPSNYCYGDSYYAKSLEQKYGKSLDELRKLVRNVYR